MNSWRTSVFAGRHSSLETFRYAFHESVRVTHEDGIAGFLCTHYELGMMSPVYREPGLCCSDNMGVTHLACVDSYLFLVQSGKLKSRRISALCSIFTRTVCRRFQPGFCWQVVWNVNAVFHDMPTSRPCTQKREPYTIILLLFG